MQNPTPNNAPTFESVWAAIQETDRQIEKSNRYLTEKFAETDRQIKESERFLTEKFAESDRQFQETKAKTEKDRLESERQYDRRMKKIEELMGSWANNQGCFAEEYFFNSFEIGEQNFLGEHFDEIEKNVKGIKKNFKDEYDIVLINGKSVGIIEVKYKAHTNDISKVLRKATTFRVNFPEYECHQIYLGLATMAFHPELEQECMAHGIAIIKQVGDMVVIRDEHLKVF